MMRHRYVSCHIIAPKIEFEKDSQGVLSSLKKWSALRRIELASAKVTFPQLLRLSWWQHPHGCVCIESAIDIYLFLSRTRTPRMIAIACESYVSIYSVLAIQSFHFQESTTLPPIFQFMIFRLDVWFAAYVPRVRFLICILFWEGNQNERAYRSL